MSRAASPFRPAVVLLVLLIGSAAFLLLLYAIGQGWDGTRERNGGEHAVSTGLTGFAGFHQLLERSGYEPTISRSEGGYDDYGLLVLTPPHFANGEELAQIIEDRRYIGPTMLVLPKWIAMPVPEMLDVEAEEGWVILSGAMPAQWINDLELGDELELAVGETKWWEGYETSGPLPDQAQVQALLEPGSAPFEPLVVDSEGDMLAGLYYADVDAWPLLVVFEPDLVNNYGMANAQRAQLAGWLVQETTDYESMPVIFDLTLSGLGKSENLLTLAFSPPFLAATLCLILAALVVAWRSFRRFGPPRAQAPAMAQGKRQLALNGAALLGRVRRWHLLGAPYAAMVAARIAAKLGLSGHDEQARERAIDRALVRQGHDGPGFGETANSLRGARSPREILRAARALRTMERTLTR